MTHTQGTIAHVMLAQGYGGIEAAYLRYTQALLAMGYEVVCVVHPKSSVAVALPSAVTVYRLAQHGQWDISAMWRVRRILRKERVDVAITHGNRASRLLWGATRGLCKQLVVLHRPRFRGVKHYDRVIAVTERLRESAVAAGARAERVIHVPNFLTEPSPTVAERADNAVPIIGCLARFVPEKGLDIFIEALAILRDKGVAFEARIGGDGLQKTAIESQISTFSLACQVRLLGWVEDTEAFYRGIDVLAVPSREESFGFIVLEAWRMGVAVVSTRTAGPESLLTDGQTGVLTEISAQALAEGLRRMLVDGAFRRSIAEAGREALEPYRMESIAPLLKATIEEMRI